MSATTQALLVGREPVLLSLPQQPGLNKFKLFVRDPKRKHKKVKVLLLGSLVLGLGFGPP